MRHRVATANDLDDDNDADGQTDDDTSLQDSIRPLCGAAQPQTGTDRQCHKRRHLDARVVTVISLWKRKHSPNTFLKYVYLMTKVDCLSSATSTRNFGKFALHFPRKTNYTGIFKWGAIGQTQQDHNQWHKRRPLNRNAGFSDPTSKLLLREKFWNKTNAEVNSIPSFSSPSKQNGHLLSSNQLVQNYQ